MSQPQPKLIYNILASYVYFQVDCETLDMSSILLFIIKNVLCFVVMGSGPAIQAVRAGDVMNY